MRTALGVTGLAAAIVGSFLTGAAHAETYAFDIGVANLFIEGELVTSNTPLVGGEYEVTGISGMVYGTNDDKITGLVDDPTPGLSYTGGSGPWIFDNLLIPASYPAVDNAGILFSAGAYEYNVYSVGSTYYLSTDNPVGNDYNPGETFVCGSISAVPELQTWAMMLMGFAGLGFAGYRKAIHGSATTAAA